MLCFVYGTLTERATAAQVLSAFSFRGAATLSGLHRVDGEYPTLVPGGDVEGRLLQTPELERLDSYEGVDQGLYVRVSVPCVGSGTETVETYVGHPARLGVADNWPGDGSFDQRVRTYLAGNDVVVSTG